MRLLLEGIINPERHPYIFERLDNGSPVYYNRLDDKCM